MNMNAMLKQAQAMQRDMMKAKEEVDNTTFEATNGFVTVTMKGTKEVTNVKLDTTSIEADDIEMVQDMIMIAVNEASHKIDKLTEEKLGKYTKGMPGLF
jgi:DNA-binding YbaB/EbfC family protein